MRVEFNKNLFANSIKEKRIAKGITQKQLGELLGLSTLLINSAERERHAGYDIYSLYKICHWLSMPMELFFIYK